MQILGVLVHTLKLDINGDEHCWQLRRHCQHCGCPHLTFLFFEFRFLWSEYVTKRFSKAKFGIKLWNVFNLIVNVPQSVCETHTRCTARIHTMCLLVKDSARHVRSLAGYYIYLIRKNSCILCVSGCMRICVLILPRAKHCMESVCLELSIKLTSMRTGLCIVTHKCSWHTHLCLQLDCETPIDLMDKFQFWAA